MDEITKYHELAKDAGNHLRAYILAVSSGATGVFFFVLTSENNTQLISSEKCLLLTAIISFVLTALLCLYELRVDAKRFFALAKELEKPEKEQEWIQNESYKNLRYWLIHLSYLTFGIAIISTSIYLILNIIGT